MFRQKHTLQEQGADRNAGVVDPVSQPGDESIPPVIPPEPAPFRRRATAARHHIIRLAMHQQHGRTMRQLAGQPLWRSSAPEHPTMPRGAIRLRSPVNSTIMAPWLNPVSA